MEKNSSRLRNTKELRSSSQPNRRITRFRPKVRSRHPTHDPLRTRLPRLPFRSVIRLGSTTDLPDTVSNGGARVECNTIQAVQTASDKFHMKEAFDRDNVMTADWMCLLNFDAFDAFVKEVGYPLIIKRRNSSRGRGIYLISTQEELDAFFEQHQDNIRDYICEKFHNFVREYRLHVTKDGCFYACRKMLKSDTPDNRRFFRNDSNSVWILEDNALFDKPVNWNTIIGECVKALNAVGLDVGACDVKVQGASDNRGQVRPNPAFIVIEINSAPSFGTLTLGKYLEELPRILTNKQNG